MINNYADVINLAITVGALVLGAYLGIVKFNISTKKDIANGFNKLNAIEQQTQEKLMHIEERIENHANQIVNVEKTLYEYLKKHEAEALYTKKDSIQPVIDNLIKTQEMLYNDIKEFRREIKDSIKAIEVSLARHVEEDREFQKELFNKLIKE